MGPCIVVGDVKAVEGVSWGFTCGCVGWSEGACGRGCGCGCNKTHTMRMYTQHYTTFVCTPTRFSAHTQTYLPTQPPPPLPHNPLPTVPLPYLLEHPTLCTLCPAPPAPPPPHCSPHPHYQHQRSQKHWQSTPAAPCMCAFPPAPGAGSARCHRHSPPMHAARWHPHTSTYAVGWAGTRKWGGKNRGVGGKKKMWVKYMFNRTRCLLLLLSANHPHQRTVSLI